MTELTLSSDVVASVDMVVGDDVDAISMTPQMKEFLENGIFETNLYINAIDGFVRLSKPDMVAIFVNNISIPTATDKINHQTKIIKEFRSEFGKVFMAKFGYQR